MPEDPLDELRAIEEERKSMFAPKCLVCRMPKKELEIIHSGRERGYSFYTLAEYAQRHGHSFQFGAVANHFRRKHSVPKG